MRAVTSQIAFETGGWTNERSTKVASLFNEMAATWNERASPERLAPLSDAFARGGPIRSGFGVELGSGTGLATPWLTGQFDRLVAVDLSAEMLRRAPASGLRVRADGAQLPFEDGTVDAVVACNMFLFPTEVNRLLARGGVLVWVSLLGDRTPIYLPVDQVADALGPEWHGVAAEAGWGTWAVLRRG
ncbi:MAG: class I SAM-dependent DNA methyltransferase [Acidimicrobiales bacterium]